MIEWVTQVMERVFEPRERGPWPQPAPGKQDRMSPSVVRLPLSEELDWNWHVRLRYWRQLLFTTPAAMVWAARNRGLKEVGDARFNEILTDGILSKFVQPLETKDEEVFAPVMGGYPGSTWFKSDFRPMDLILDPVQGRTASSVVLWQRVAHHRYEARAILVEKRVFVPTEGARWQAAKYFALQGAGVLTTIMMHPLLHFPTDAINAVTRTRLPHQHLLRKLLRPHLRLSLAVNRSVLQGASTVLGPGWVYSPYPGRLEHNLEVVSVLWQGYPRWSPSRAFPRYLFPLDRPVVHAGYGDFLGSYWDAIFVFVKDVVEAIAREDEDVRQWANHIAHWIPGFPDGQAIFEGDRLARAVTSVIHTVSVAHTADHWIYHREVDPREVPFRLRLAVPGDDVGYESLEPSEMVSWYDNVNYRMCSEMFFRPFAVTRLAEVNYRFSSAALQVRNQRFWGELAGVEQQMQRTNRRIYIPLREIACGVQF